MNEMKINENENKMKIKLKIRMTELGEYFSGTKPLTSVKKNETLEMVKKREKEIKQTMK